MSKAVKTVASVAVGVVVGVFAGPAAGFAAFSLAMGVSGALQPDIGGQQSSTSTELKQVIRSSKEPAHYQFGRSAVGGLLAWAQEEPGDQTDGERLHMVYVLSEGEIEALDEVYLNQEPISEAGDLADYELIVSPNVADDYLLEHSPDWRDNQLGKGLSYVRLTLKYDRDYYAAGIPAPLFVIRGNRDIYDPRTETTGYSENAALVMLWYVRTRLGVPDDEILWESFIDAANVCDELVPVPGGGTEPRYTVGGGFKADERKDRVISDLEAACAGSLIRIGGKFGLQVGAYYGPYEIEIDEDMVIGTVSGQTEVSRADAVNTVRGKFVDPGQRWAETDYPAVSVQEWIDEDGEEISDSLDFRFVPSPYQAQRLANFALRRKRAGGSLELPLNFRGYACRPGRVVRVNLPSLNIDGEFRVIDWDFHGDSGCKVVLQQEDPEIYDDAVGQPFNPLGFISLPTGGIGAPTGLTYSEHVVGEVLQGRLSWNGVGAALHYNVVIRRDGVVEQSAQVPGGVTRCEIGGLEAGEYVAEVRARGQLGLSGAATATFSVATPPLPTNVTIHATNDTVTLIPRILGYAPPVQFEFRWAPESMPLNQVEANAEYLSIGASLVHAGRSWGTEYHYWIRSVNAYGRSGWHYLSVTTTEDFEDILTIIDEEIRRPGGLYDNVIEGATTAAEKAAEASLQEIRGEMDEQFEGVDAGFGEIERVQQNADRLEAIRHAAAIAKTAAASAYVRTEEVTRVDETSALSQQLTTLGVSMNDQYAQVQQELIAVYDDETGAVARAVTVAEVNGRKAVMGIQVDGTVAEIGAVADRFYILNPIGGEYVLAFVVEGGQVVVPDARIGRVTFTKLRADDGSLVFQNGKLRAQFIEFTELVSTVTVNGRPSYAFRQNGTFEMNWSASGGRVQQDGDGTRVYDATGRIRVRMGRLS